jgi:casein kinase II subunit beta
MSESDSYSSEESYGWINWFCNLEDHQFFCRVDEEYIRDSFNLYGLKQMFDHYKSIIIYSAKPSK